MEYEYGAQAGHNETQQDTAQLRKQSRENTIEEKRRMRKNRKRRQRKHLRMSKKVLVSSLKSEVKNEQRLREESEMKVIHYKRMARSYWECCQWELHQRKGALLQERQCNTILRVPHLLEIDQTLLHDPVVKTEVFVGQGSFGIVKMKLFRGIKVAVKELQPRTVLSDVRNEAHTLAKLSHPFLPYLFGVCTTSQPYKIVMQFHGIRESSMSFTLYGAIVRKKIADSYAWLGISIQLFEALSYLHNEVQILHNDINSNNVLLTDAMTESPS